MLITFQSHLESKIKLYILPTCINICSFQNKVYQLIYLLYSNRSAVHYLHSTVLAFTFMPSRFEAHGSSFITCWDTSHTRKLTFEAAKT